jgi:hypothetical protein
MGILEKDKAIVGVEHDFCLRNTVIEVQASQHVRYAGEVRVTFRAVRKLEPAAQVESKGFVVKAVLIDKDNLGIKGRRGLKFE